jgi:hypothetical protein
MEVFLCLNLGLGKNQAINVYHMKVMNYSCSFCFPQVHFLLPPPPPRPCSPFLSFVLIIKLSVKSCQEDWSIYHKSANLYSPEGKSEPWLVSIWF